VPLGRNWPTQDLAGPAAHGWNRGGTRSKALAGGGGRIRQAAAWWGGAVGQRDGRWGGGPFGAAGRMGAHLWAFVAATVVGRWGDSADGLEVRARVAPERSTRCPTVGRCSSTRGQGDFGAGCSQHRRGGLWHGRRLRLVNLRDCSRGRLYGVGPAAPAALEARRGIPSATAPSARSGAARTAKGGDGFTCT
jgi:hypothetical protein